MSGAVKSTTPSLTLRLLNFNFPNWGDDANTNMQIIDAAFALIGLSITGAWDNSIAYTAGQLIVDADDNSLWRVAVTHTSAASGTFATDRAAHPTYWTATTVPIVLRGAWVTATQYNVNDIVNQGYNWAIYTKSYISGASLAADIAAGKAVTIVDNTAAVTITSAAAVSTAADRVQTGLDRVQTTADRVQTTADRVQTGLDRTQTGTDATTSTTSKNASVAAQVAAEAARDATLAAYDSFDDRYLGTKAANPTLDNDGNALLAGSLYYNTVVPEMRLYTGSAWVAAYVSGGTYAVLANNGSDFPNATTFRTNLSLYSKAEDALRWAIDTLAATAKTTIAVGDLFAIVDSAASNVIKQITWANILVGVNAGLNATAKAVPVLADRVYIGDSAASNAMKYSTFTQIKANIWDAAYQAASAVLTTLAGIGTAVTGDVIYASGAGAWARRAIGSTLQVLTISGGVPVWATPIFSKEFVSSQQTITSTGALTLAHGLGAQPKLWNVFIQCVTAEFNYSIGDELQNWASGSISLVPDATNLNIRFNLAATDFSGINKTTGAVVNFTNANWRMVVRAWL